MAVVYGPFFGALTGGLTNVALGIIQNPKNIPFALVNIAVGIVVGLIGINNSPTCSIVGEKGILMEELLYLCKEENIELKLIDVPTDYVDGEKRKGFINKLKSFLKGL